MSTSRFSGEDLRERRADFERLLAEFAQAIHAGVFHVALDEERHCKCCDFDDVCPTARFADDQAKVGDPRALAFAEFREIE